MSKKKSQLIIGLTGGIGSGKTTVAQMFQSLGVDIIDADQISHELLKPNTAYFKKVVSYFGPSILDEKRQINRRYLRTLMLRSSQNREWLENLLHPSIAKKMQQNLKKSHSAYTILVLPLLFEAGLEWMVNRICVVDTTQKLQLKRIRQRDHFSYAEIKKMIGVQVSRKQRLKQADDIISNTGHLSDLKQSVKALHKMYLFLAQSFMKVRYVR